MVYSSCELRCGTAERWACPQYLYKNIIQGTTIITTPKREKSSANRNSWHEFLLHLPRATLLFLFILQHTEKEDEWKINTKSRVGILTVDEGLNTPPLPPEIRAPCLGGVVLFLPCLYAEYKPIKNKRTACLLVLTNTYYFSPVVHNASHSECFKELNTVQLLSFQTM